MIRPILKLGNEVLRRKSQPVMDFQNRHLDSLIEDLADTLRHTQKKLHYGRGIAAPQIGKLKRVIFIDTPSFKAPLINPEIIWASNAKIEIWDSCFSFNLAFFVLLDRSFQVRLNYMDKNGKKQTIDAKEDLSELLQHEIDHLNGILAIDRMKEKKVMMRSEWEKTKRVEYRFS
ncbi:MAG: peptide deformylase [Candidatus Bathyarchaeota archaeon]|nr:peptide deformylase [Candidatus Bathyarchaeota archaeon]